MQGNKPAFGNSKQKIIKTMVKDHGEDMDVEYRLSAWLQIDNGWDSMENRPVPMTREQQAQVDEVVNLLGKYNMQLSMQVQERKGAEVKDYPLVARWRLFFNKEKQTSGSVSHETNRMSDNDFNEMNTPPQENNLPPMDVPDSTETTTPQNAGSSMWKDL